MLSPVYQVVLGKAVGSSACSFWRSGRAVDPARDLVGQVDSGQLAQAVAGRHVLDGVVAVGAPAAARTGRPGCRSSSRSDLAMAEDVDLAGVGRLGRP